MDDQEKDCFTENESTHQLTMFEDEKQVSQACEEEESDADAMDSEELPPAMIDMLFHDIIEEEERETELFSDTEAQIMDLDESCSVYHFYIKKHEYIRHVGKKDFILAKRRHRTVPVYILEDTSLQIKTIQKNQPFHILAVKLKECYIARAICDDRFYNLFQPTLHLNTKLKYIQQLCTFPENQQNFYIARKYGRKSLPDGAKIKVLTDTWELKYLYKLFKYMYTLEQQENIETLFDYRPAPYERDRPARKLECLLNIFTNEEVACKISATKMRRKLDHLVYGMHTVKDILQQQYVANQKTKNNGFSVLLVGDKGVGKQSMAKAFAEIVQRPFVSLSLENAEAMDLQGVNPCYDNSDIGIFTKKLAAVGTTACVYCLTDVDKLSPKNKDGNPLHSLKNIVSQSEPFHNSFLEMNLDLSKTYFFATAETTELLPQSLLNVFSAVIHVETYQTQDRLEIAKRFLIPEQLKKYGIKKEEIRFTEQALLTILQQYCDDLGCNKLKESIASLVRYVLLQWDITRNRTPQTITEDVVCRVLEQRVHEDDAYLCYARNKEKMNPEVQKEFENVLHRLNSTELTNEEKAMYGKKAKYFTALYAAKQENHPFDIEEFTRCLEESHFGLQDIKERIAKMFYARSLQSQSLLNKALLLVGPPGSGKTTIAQSIAKGLHRSFIKISLNGMIDSSWLKGSTYDAGRVVTGLSQMKTTQAVVLLDEVDKLTEPMACVLLDLLEQNFTDRFLGVPVDLSDVLCIATANKKDTIPPWVLDRLDLICLDGYTTKERKQLLVQHLLPKVAAQYTKANMQISITPEAIDALVCKYCVSMGVRELEKTVQNLAEDKLYETKSEHLELTLQDVERNLSQTHITRGNLLPKNVPGYAKALAVFGGGNYGMAFSVETTILPDEATDCLTGLPKESTIDSVKLAKTYIRMHYTDGKDFKLHLHFGEGAVEKDGPSAGVAIFMSILSALWKKPIPEDVAYTGELDLFGNVFSVGGVLAKLEGAQQSGCTKVFLPKAALQQVKPERLKAFSMQLIPIEHIDEVVQALFPTCTE